MPAPMSSPFGELTVVVDARPGGAAGRIPLVEEALRERGLLYRLALAQRDGDAERLVGHALREGRRYIVAVGGDDLVHEAVNGMLQGDRPAVDRPVLGLVPSGATNDVATTFGLPGDPDRACAHLAGHGTYPTDVVKVTTTGQEGEPLVRYFVNVATVGLWAEVAARESAMPAVLGRARRFLAFWGTVARFRPVPVRIRSDRRTYEGTAHAVILGNCQFADGGMKLSPRSYPGDGVLDVQVFAGPVSDAFRMLWPMARGEHLPNSNVVESRAKERVEVEADRPLRVQADGRLLGTTPAAFEVLPQPILVKL